MRRLLATSVCFAGLCACSGNTNDVAGADALRSRPLALESLAAGVPCHAGCYGFQIDTVAGSDVVVIAVVDA